MNLKNNETEAMTANKSKSNVDLQVTLQPNTLQLIDCMDFMRECPSNYFDLAIVDPPYGMNVTKLKIKANKKGKDWDASPPDLEYYNELFRVSKNQVVWGMNFLNDYLPRSERTVVWDKQNDGTYGSDYELAWTSFKGAKQLIYRQMWYGYFYPKEDLPLLHPTQKPLGLYRFLLNEFAKAGDKILDTHVGSGSSLVACKELGFEYYGCEIDEEYFAKANERIARAYRKYELFE